MPYVQLNSIKGAFHQSAAVLNCFGPIIVILYLFWVSEGNGEFEWIGGVSHYHKDCYYAIQWVIYVLNVVNFICLTWLPFYTFREATEIADHDIAKVSIYVYVQLSISCTPE